MLKKVQEFYRKNQKYKPFLFIGGLCLIAVFGVTIAYYTQEISLVNEFNTKKYDVSMEEEFNNTWGTKKVTIINSESTNTPVLLRVSYSEIWSNGDNILNNLVDGVNVVNKTWSEAFLNGFTLDDDGWYYYNRILSGNESVELLQSIQLDSTIASTYPEYTHYDYDLNFNYEAIQASVIAAKQVWNKDVEISGSSVVWQ